jgi:hypothetical protein
MSPLGKLISTITNGQHRVSPRLRVEVLRVWWNDGLYDLEHLGGRYPTIRAALRRSFPQCPPGRLMSRYQALTWLS